MKYNDAKKYIPNGTQLYSKKSNLYSKKYPYDYSLASGIEIISNKNHYYDYSTMAQGSCMLGYNNSIIRNAVIDTINKGNMTSLNSELEIKLAKKLRDHEPNKIYRYFKTGGEALSAAVRIARSHTGKSLVLCNGYHGWHDWYLASNFLENKNHLGISTVEGVPIELYGTSIYFKNKKYLEELIEIHKDRIACVVIELARYKLIDQEIIDILIKSGLIIIVDEVTTGWRIQLGGLWKQFKKFNPDMIVYGKAISNGYSFSMMAMKKKFKLAVENTFISSLYWTDSIGMVAAYATITELENKNYIELRNYELEIRKHIDNKFQSSDGIGMIHYNPKTRVKWIEYCLKKGLLVTDQFYPTFAHLNYSPNKFIEAINNYEDVE